MQARFNRKTTACPGRASARGSRARRVQQAIIAAVLASSPVPGTRRQRRTSPGPAEMLLEQYQPYNITDYAPNVQPGRFRRPHRTASIDERRPIAQDGGPQLPAMPRPS
ncbi:hypothetical protein SALB1_0700 [Salinisphaera sp. LB1]|nr:hypothetical protein SALB1_0700 [Salinisphaera sp. LB1]